MFLTAAPPSFMQQRLLVEFSGLQHADLDGVLISMMPGQPSIWVGILINHYRSRLQPCSFRRPLYTWDPRLFAYSSQGPYAPAVLRFKISFPASYPVLPPLVTFSTDVFHPLLTPLTTYTYTTGSSDTETVSATDEERLPPGGFSLRHGFPQWFGRANRSSPNARHVGYPKVADAVDPDQSQIFRGNAAQAIALAVLRVQEKSSTFPAIIDVLLYIRSTFSDATVLDSIAMDAAANSGAFHAWRAYRSATSQASDRSSSSAPNHIPLADADTGANTARLGNTRHPGQWNWEGVWQERVDKAIKASVTDAALFGSNGSEDIIRFRELDDAAIGTMQKQLQCTS